jgi:hypothetical protein
VCPAHSLISVLSQVPVIQRGDLDAAAEERALCGYCGYIFCEKPIPKTRSSLPRDALFYRNNQFINASLLRDFCSLECRADLHVLREQLSDEPLWMRDDKYVKSRAYAFAQCAGMQMVPAGHSLS